MIPPIHPEAFIAGVIGMFGLPIVMRVINGVKSTSDDSHAHNHTSYITYGIRGLCSGIGVIEAINAMLCAAYAVYPASLSFIERYIPYHFHPLETVFVNGEQYQVAVFMVLGGFALLIFVFWEVIENIIGR